MVRFFIDRPIFATVLSLAITLAGALAVGTLPLSQYPPVTPPTIQVDCNYPGASAQVVAEAIAAPVEQQVNGVEKMLYMTSQCTSDGSYTLTVTFDIGTDLNMAQVLVQNRVNLALPNLPDVVRATGVTTRKRSPEILMTVSLNSPSGKYNQLYLSNYALTRMKDDLSRLPGISDVTLFGQRDFSMRVWVDPDKLAARSLTALDVVRAIREQNAQVAAGQISQLRSPATARCNSRSPPRAGSLKSPISRHHRAGERRRARQSQRRGTRRTRVKNQDVSNRFDNKPTIGLAIFLLTGANALETGDMVQDAVEKMRLGMPEE
ncbi:MAG: efflux RND transporter permease subunit [Gemmataceae bacterium]